MNSRGFKCYFSMSRDVLGISSNFFSDFWMSLYIRTQASRLSYYHYYEMAILFIRLSKIKFNYSVVTLAG